MSCQSRLSSLELNWEAPLQRVRQLQNIVITIHPWLLFDIFKLSPLHNVQFVKYDVTVSFMAQVLDTVTYLVPQVLDTAS